MADVLKSIAGFLGILLVSLVGVAISEMMKLGSASALIATVDNITHIK
jgi:hypothetical protein